LLADAVPAEDQSVTLVAQVVETYPRVGARETAILAIDFALLSTNLRGDVLSIE
jgi:hypothetical protein